MSKISSNRFAQAKKEIEAIDPELVKRIPETIKESDKKHYHVALVKISDRPGQVKNDVSVNVQTYHPHAFKKLEKSFIFHGFAKIVVVHDPTKATQAAKVDPAANKDGGKEDDKTKTPAKPKNDGKTDGNDPGSEDEAAKLEKAYQNAIGGNKPELVDFAETHGVDLTEASNNDQRVEAITAWFNNKMDELSKD